MAINVCLNLCVSDREEDNTLENATPGNFYILTENLTGSLLELLGEG